MKRIHAKRHVRELITEEHYAGDMDIGGVSIEFELKFCKPLSVIREMHHHMMMARLVTLFSLTIKRKGCKPIGCLSEHQFETLVAMLYKAVVQAQTISSTIRVRGGDHNTIAKVGITNAGEFLVSQPERHVLNELFGCDLPD